MTTFVHIYIYSNYTTHITHTTTIGETTTFLLSLQPTFHNVLRRRIGFFPMSIFRCKLHCSVIDRRRELRILSNDLSVSIRSVHILQSVSSEGTFLSAFLFDYYIWFVTQFLCRSCQAQFFSVQDLRSFRILFSSWLPCSIRHWLTNSNTPRENGSYHLVVEHESQLSPIDRVSISSKLIIPSGLLLHLPNYPLTKPL